MKRFYIFFFFAAIISSCHNRSEIRLDDPMESGREFIDASLKGDYDMARKYILQDSLNINYLERLKEWYKTRPEAEKEKYKNANIIINPTENINDSELIINYSNTFKNIPSKIKMIRRNKEWRVDFKYTFSGNM